MFNLKMYVLFTLYMNRILYLIFTIKFWNLNIDIITIFNFFINIKLLLHLIKIIVYSVN